MPNQQWLVDPYNPTNMAEGMQRMLALPSDMRAEIIRQNEAHARKFTWDKTAGRMIQIFQELVGIGG